MCNFTSCSPQKGVLNAYSTWIPICNSAWVWTGGVRLILRGPPLPAGAAGFGPPWRATRYRRSSADTAALPGVGLNAIVSSSFWLVRRDRAVPVAAGPRGRGAARPRAAEHGDATFPNNNFPRSLSGCLGPTPPRQAGQSLQPASPQRRRLGSITGQAHGHRASPWLTLPVVTAICLVHKPT